MKKALKIISNMTIIYQINLLIKDCPNEGTDTDEVGETVPEN